MEEISTVGRRQYQINRALTGDAVLGVVNFNHVKACSNGPLDGGNPRRFEFFNIFLRHLFGIS